MLCDRLKELREESGLNQEEIANKINVVRATYSNYEIGRVEPGISVLISLSNLYNVSIDYLCGTTDIKERYYKDARLCKFINKCLLLYKEFF